MTIDHERIAINTIVQNGDCLRHYTHRHEPSVLGLPVGVLHETDDIVVVDKVSPKTLSVCFIYPQSPLLVLVFLLLLLLLRAAPQPPSMPMHPCGGYRHNSLVYILAKDLALRDIFLIHRLDRVTSGVVVVGKTPAAAQVPSLSTPLHLYVPITHAHYS